MFKPQPCTVEREKNSVCDNLIFNRIMIEEISSEKKKKSMAIFPERCEAEWENVTGDS